MKEMFREVKWPIKLSNILTTLWSKSPIPLFQPRVIEKLVSASGGGILEIIIIGVTKMYYLLKDQIHQLNLVTMLLEHQIV